MAIKLTPVAQVEQTLDVFVPKPKGGHEKNTIGATYRLLSRPELKDTMAAIQSDEMTADDVLRRDVLDLHDIKDADNKPVVFSPDLLNALIDRTDTFRALDQGWYDVQTQREAHAEKN